MNKSVITKSFEETQSYAEEFVKINKNRRIFALYGDLGSGKTTFVQGLARGFGIERKIISPTFIIIRFYEIKNAKRKMQNNNVKFKMFYHIDLYRLKDASEIDGLGLEEIIGNNENIVAIEWPEKMGNLLHDDRMNLHFEYIDENSRNIRID